MVVEMPLNVICRAQYLTRDAGQMITHDRVATT
jgi:hypothetical protein